MYMRVRPIYRMGPGASDGAIGRPATVHGHGVQHLRDGVHAVLRCAAFGFYEVHSRAESAAYPVQCERVHLLRRQDWGARIDGVQAHPDRGSEVIRRLANHIQNDPTECVQSALRGMAV